MSCQLRAVPICFFYLIFWIARLLLPLNTNILLAIKKLLSDGVYVEKININEKESKGKTSLK
uniref:Uncharacterized protein n=1 Tax=Nelumbo nucifera TaxID=4432 RepID=A0A822Z6E2_NELNU|nr:TPA_asm: hypothetical protein HUJ06_013291 [Nelumbo nucifera]